ncbi:NAD(P)H-binding protein [Streptomyces sp. NPDC057617]|uniref:NAD(P)H-binding protein n=1 Tax=Streptomyces sp. NPDC057617 TaxID=3346184 RepID=UPI00367B7C41
MTPETILVIGGTGKTGRRVVARLREQGVPVRAVSRAGDVRFDWEDRATWKAALDGVSGAYIVPLDTTPSRTPDLVAQAVACGVGRLVLLSARGADIPGYFGPTFDGGPHIEGEEAVRASGMPWTVLRPGWFAQNFSEGAFRDEVAAGELGLYAGDGAASFVDAEDVAAVAVAALTGPGHEGRVYELSGPRALTVDEALAEIGRATGHRARYLPLDAAAYRARLISRGVSEAEAAVWADALKPIRTSWEAPVLDGVARALGRPPRDFAEFARAEAARGAWRA